MHRSGDSVLVLALQGTPRGRTKVTKLLLGNVGSDGILGGKGG